MPDNFANHFKRLDSPGGVHFAITPGPGDINPRPRVLYCNVAGTATLVDETGASLVYNLTAGQLLPFRAVKVTAATATIFGWE